MTETFDYVFVRHIGPAPVAGALLNIARDNFPNGYVPETAFGLALAPTQISYSAHAPTTVRMTQGSTSIQRARFRAYEVSMTLDFGLRDKTGFDAEGHPRRASGPVLADEFAKWIQALWDSGSDRSATPGARRMTFHDTRRSRHLWIEPNSVQFREGGETQLYPIVQLTMTGYELTDWPTSGAGLALTMGAKLQEWIDYPKRYIEIGLGYASLANTALHAAADAIAGVLDYGSYAVEALNTFTAILDGTTRLVDVGAAWYEGIDRRVGSALEHINHGMRKLDTASEQWRAAADARSAQISLRRMVQAGALVAGGGYAAEGGGAGAFHTVVIGEDLQRIALKLLGDAGKWKELAASNGIAPPYTLTPGDKIKLPPGVVGSAAEAVASALATGAADLLGQDLALDDDGDLAVESGSFPSDVAKVHGVACVVQGIGKIQFQTTAGENLMFPAMGLPEAVGDIPNKAAGVFLALSIAQLYRDDRIVRVSDERVKASGLGYDVTMTAALKSGQRVGVATTAKAG